MGDQLLKIRELELQFSKLPGSNFKYYFFNKMFLLKRHINVIFLNKVGDIVNKFKLQIDYLTNENKVIKFWQIMQKN